MTLYTRMMDGIEIEWKKEGEMAERAVKEVTEKSDFPVEVDKETAEEIRSRYLELLDEQEE